MTEESLSPDVVAQQLERMLASGVFRSASRSSTLLRFLVEQTLGGKADRLKDYTLGAEALGRGESFDPRTDPIARVEAGRLRQRLDLYYATEGTGDLVVITLPKGGYVPTFERAATTAAAAEPMPDRTGGRRWVAWAAGAAVALAGVVAVLSWRAWLPAAAPPEMRLEINTPPTTDPVSFALSPDGQQIVFVASDNGTPRLWLRALASTTPRPLQGTEHAAFPFWHPDGRSVGFFADEAVKRIDIEGGLVEPISRAAVPAGAAVNRQGVVVNPLVPDSPLFRRQGSGLPVPLTVLSPGQTGHRAPQFLPDDVHFLFYVMGTPATRGVYAGSLSGDPPRRLTDADSPAVFSREHLFYLKQGTLFAQPFDADRLSTTGDPQRVAERVATSAGSGIAALAASAAGTIAFRTGPSGGRRQFVWFDRAGKELSRIGSAENFGASYASISPDYRRLAVQRTRDGNTDVWLIDLERGTPIRFTSGPQADIAPLWSPLGDSVVFSSLLGAAGVAPTFGLYSQSLAGGVMQPFLTDGKAMQATDWTRDGRLLLYRTVDTQRADMDIWAIAVDGDRRPFPVVKTSFEERDGQFSPDGQWIAYQSNESGRFEIYVRRLDGTGERQRISTNGGVQVRWRADGRELFYLTLDSQLTAVPLTSSGQGFRAGGATALFRAPVGALQGIALHNYIVSQDGQRFLLDTAVEEPAPPIVLILNWKPAAR